MNIRLLALHQVVQANEIFGMTQVIQFLNIEVHQPGLLSQQE